MGRSGNERRWEWPIFPDPYSHGKEFPQIFFTVVLFHCSWHKILKDDWFQNIVNGVFRIFIFSTTDAQFSVEKDLGGGTSEREGMVTDCTEMGGNGNVKIHFRSSLQYSPSIQPLNNDLL